MFQLKKENEANIWRRPGVLLCLFAYIGVQHVLSNMEGSL
jgi:hypothetical protein